MPIYQLLQKTSFDADTVKCLAEAFENVCRELGLAERNDPLRDTVARKVIELAGAGDCDPIELREKTLQALRE